MAGESTTLGKHSFPEKTLLVQNSDSTPIQIDRIEVIGSTVFKEQDFLPIIEPLQGKSVSRTELLSAVDAITQLYIDNNYITSDAGLVEESLTTGVIQIQIIEGSVEEIIVEGTQRLHANYVRKRIALGTSTPFNPKKLEDQLRLLRSNPLFENVEASLRRGTGLNQSIIVVRVEEANPFAGSFSIDNYSPPSIGSERLGLDLAYRNLTGNGDQLAASYETTTAGGADKWDFSYTLPVNALNGTVQLRTLIDRNRVIQEPFTSLNIEGESELVELAYRQPLILTPREELALSLGFTYENGQTFLLDQPQGFGFGPDADGVSRTSVVKFGQEYIRRSESGAWAFRSSFNFGTGLFDATTNQSPIPDGQFFSWLGQTQRIQILNPNNFLIIQADFQLSSDPLLPSQQFIIGGGQSVRGYRQNLLAGDQGLRFSLEDRIILQRDESGVPTFQLAPFFDAGTVSNLDDNPNKITQEQTFIAGIGLGVLWQPLPRFNLRLDYGFPLVEIDNKGTNAQDEGFYFQVNYEF